MSAYWGLIRLIAIGIALAVVFALMWRHELDSRLRLVLIGAALLFALRVYLEIAQHRRRGHPRER